MMFIMMSLLNLSVMSTFGVQIFQVSAQDSSSTDAEMRFIVYPDGRVGVAGVLNYTDIDLQYTGPVTQGVMAFSKSDELTSASMNCTFTIPPEVLSEFPFDSADFTLFSTGSEDVFDTEIDCSAVLSEALASQFPFNITDFTATGQYENDLLTGTITVLMLPGFAFDLDVDFEGNRTDLFFNGTIPVKYGTYYGLELNETSLEELIQNINSTIPGQGPESLYNMTNGILECTMLNVTVTPDNAVDATIDFEANIHGDFVEALAYLPIIFPPSYLPIIFPPYYPPETFELLYAALNATYSSVEGVSFELAYAHIPKEVSMTLGLVIDFNKFVEELIPLLQETGPPPEIAQLIESLLGTRYCSVKSVDLSLSYDDGEGDLKAFVTIEGDLNAELSYLKNILLLSYYAAAMIDGVPQELPWQQLFINETEIDVSNFTVSFNIAETSYGGYFGGLTVLPPLDVINATSFKLERFFNLTADASFPGERDRLKVTVIGGSNATHTVTLARPETTPEPTRVCDNRIMIWDNQTLSDLKDLIFNIQPETGTIVCDIADPELVSAENPFIIDATETAATLLNITEISKPVTIIIRNVTAPPEGVGPPSGTFKVLGNYVEITASETDITVNATIRIYYTPEQLEAAGLDEDTLEIHYWDATLGEWVAVESHVNTTEHYVWAIIDHFSLWVIMGKPLSPSIWTQLWFWALMGCIIVVVVAATLYVVRRKRQPSPAPQEPTKTLESDTSKTVP